MNSQTLISNLKYTVISSGSACSSRDLEPSYVLEGMGLEDSIIKSAVRIGVGRFTTKNDINIAIREIINIVRKIRC